MKKILIGSLIVLVLFSSCFKSQDTQPSCNSTYDPCALKATAAEVDSVEKYLASKGIYDAVKHCSGMYYKIDSVGTGKTADICSVIGVKYIGRLANDTIFDQSSNATAFNLGQLIAGFKNGIPLIKEGGSIHLYVPPSLGFGSRQNDKIPPNSMLIFQVNLVGIR